MSTELIQRSLCNEGPDYESLSASLVIILNLLNCDSDCKLEKNTGYDILKKLFLSGNNGEDPNLWFDVEDADCDRCGCIKYFSCFDERIVYYYTKDCNIASYPWKPKPDPCIEKAVLLVLEKFEELPRPLETFKEITDGVVLYLAYCLELESFTNILTMINALCELIKQRVYFDRMLRKSLITTSKCE